MIDTDRTNYLRTIARHGMEHQCPHPPLAPEGERWYCSPCANLYAVACGLNEALDELATSEKK